jgi:Zn-dependent metalloprotease
MAKSPDSSVRQWALDSIVTSSEIRAVRQTLAAMGAMAAIPSPAAKKHRLIYDMNRRPAFYLPGTLVRSEGDATSDDPAVNEAYNYSGATYDFYKRLFNRNSLDDHGMSLISSVHLGVRYNNAFWNGEQMAYGDGDGRIFKRFTMSLDVVGHELTHGVVTHTSNLEYQDEPGALNEHFADVMGTLVKQWRKRQTVSKANWLIGDDIIIKTPTRKALRNMAAPGTAYQNDPDIGSDPQPAHMTNKYRGTADHGGVHINSGIPNHAFYLAAMRIGGKAWEKAGIIWYKTLVALTKTSQFADAAVNSYQIAGGQFGSGSNEQKAVRDAWKDVGINV